MAGQPEKIDGIAPQSAATEDTYLVVVNKPAGGGNTLGLLPTSALPGGGEADAPAWGGIGGSLSNQTDLYAALEAKADGSHGHAAATTVAAGFMSAADKTKLGGIEAAAQVNLTGLQTVQLIDTALGGSGWQAGAAAVSTYTLVMLAYNSADGAVIADGATGNVNYDEATYDLDGSVELDTASPWEILFNDTGEFLIKAAFSLNYVNANVKGLATVTLRTNASGSWGAVPGATECLSEAGASSNPALQNDSGDVVGYLNLTSTGKKVVVQVAPASSNSDCKTIGGTCTIEIYKLGVVGGGSGSPATWYDEDSSLGQQTKLKFKGAGVTAAVVGDAVEVTIPGTALVAGSDRQVQFNNDGNTEGAAGVTVLSPANTRGLSNHVLQAVNVELDLVLEDLASGGTASPNPANGAEHRILLTGNATISAAAMDGSDLANNRIRVVNCLLFNNTANTVTVQTPTGAAAAGLWVRAWGSDGLSATSFQIPAYARKECAAIIYRDASGTLFTEWRG